MERATIEFDDKLVQPQQFEQLIKKLGYEPIPEKAADMGQVELKVSGMTCAACSARIEKKLAGLDGVTLVNVNLTTERASIAFEPSQIKVGDMIRVIEALGYSAEKVENVNRDQEKELKEKEIRDLRISLYISALLSFPLVAAMILSILKIHIPALAFLHNQYFQLIIATPVQFIIGARFYKHAYYALRSGSPNMDVLIVMGTSAAYFFSLYNIFLRR
jgi:Cu+-exporting ATPase